MTRLKDKISTEWHRFPAEEDEVARWERLVDGETHTVVIGECAEVVEADYYASYSTAEDGGCGGRGAESYAGAKRDAMRLMAFHGPRREQHIEAV